MGGGWTKTIIIGWWVDEKNNSAKIDWVDLDQKNNFPVADFFRQGGLFNSRAVLERIL